MGLGLGLGLGWGLGLGLGVGVGLGLGRGLGLGLARPSAISPTPEPSLESRRTQKVKVCCPLETAGSIGTARYSEPAGWKVSSPPSTCNRR